MTTEPVSCIALVRPLVDRRKRFALVYHSEASRTPIEVFIVGTPRHPMVEIQMPALNLSDAECEAFIEALRVAKQEGLRMAQERLAGHVPESASTSKETMHPCG